MHQATVTREVLTDRDADWDALAYGYGCRYALAGQHTCVEKVLDLS